MVSSSPLKWAAVVSANETCARDWMCMDRMRNDESTEYSFLFVLHSSYSSSDGRLTDLRNLSFCRRQCGVCLFAEMVYSVHYYYHFHEQTVEWIYWWFLSFLFSARPQNYCSVRQCRTKYTQTHTLTKFIDFAHLSCCGEVKWHIAPTVWISGLIYALIAIAWSWQSIDCMSGSPNRSR